MGLPGLQLSSNSEQEGKTHPQVSRIRKSAKGSGWVQKPIIRSLPPQEAAGATLRKKGQTGGHMRPHLLCSAQLQERGEWERGGGGSSHSIWTLLGEVSSQGESLQ